MIVQQDRGETTSSDLRHELALKDIESNCMRLYTPQQDIVRETSNKIIINSVNAMVK